MNDISNDKHRKSYINTINKDFKIEYEIDLYTNNNNNNVDNNNIENTKRNSHQYSILNKKNKKSSNKLSFIFKSNEDIEQELMYDSESSSSTNTNKKNNEKEKLEKLVDNENNDNINNLSPSKKTLKERLFSKVEAGSIRGSVFSMCSIAIGAGSLSLPKMFAKTSLFIGVISLIFAACASLVSLKWIILSTKKYKIYDYSKLVSIVIGKKTGKFLDSIILIYIFGALISFHVISKF